MVRQRTESMMTAHSSRRASIDESMEKLDKSKDSQCDINYKTELCRTWVEKNFCPYREKCRFAHGKKDLHDKVINSKNYKQKECNSFHNRGFCPYGPRCHFKHEERTMDNIDRTFYSFLLQTQYDGADNYQPKAATKRLPVFESLRPGKKLYSLNLKNIHQYTPSGRNFFFSKKFLDSCM